MSLFVAMAHFDPDGMVALHVRHNIEALRKVADRVVFVSTADLRPSEVDWLRERVELVTRANYGYDFFSYREALLNSGDLGGYDRVLICNDSFVGPLVDYTTIFDAMDAKPCDFWGLTRTDRIQPHVQSFFVCFNSWVVRSHAFQRFWRTMVPVSERRLVIRRYEIGLSAALEEAGFGFGSYFNEDDADRRIARRRMVWRAALRSQQPRRETRDEFDELRAEPWNPCAGLADRALGAARLPFVKIDTLRYDPYRLGAERLLAAGERQHPAAFAGVREFLARTAKYYPPRAGEDLPAPTALVRPLYSLVRYA